VVDGLTQGRWDSIALDFTRDARRNDGSPEPFGEGERMDDFKLFAGQPHQAANYELLIDDVIFFATDPALPPEPEPFPNRVILLAAFDTGPKERYWPGDFELVEDPPVGAFWRAAKGVPRRDGKGPFIRLGIEPPRPVGGHTKLRFRYFLTGATACTVQIFDATVQDNRHVRLTDLKQGEWTTLYLDFSKDSRRNDGTPNSPFAAGNLVDDLFFFLEGGRGNPTLFVDEVVLFDAAATGPSRPTQSRYQSNGVGANQHIIRKAHEGDNWPVTWASGLGPARTDDVRLQFAGNGPDSSIETICSLHPLPDVLNGHEVIFRRIWSAVKIRPKALLNKAVAGMRAGNGDVSGGGSDPCNR
jgi:hypothetical protein